MNKILITGGAGYIGSHTVHYLVKKIGFSPADIIVFDNLVYGHRYSLPRGVKLVKADLLDKKKITSIFQKNKIDSVVHFAAYAFVGESMEQPGKYFENNVQGGVNLLEAMVAGDCRKIIFSSTCATYGIPKNIPITEIELPRPINPYGESKLMFEKILEWYGQIHRIKSVRLRYFNAAGADFGIGEDHNPETHLIPRVLAVALGKLPAVQIYGNDYETPDGTCLRDYIHVTDLADAHARALKLLDQPNFVTDCINLGTGQGTSVLEIINLVKKVSGLDFSIENFPRRAGDPAKLIASPEKAAKVLGWRSEKGMEEIIRSAWEWAKK